MWGFLVSRSTPACVERLIRVSPSCSSQVRSNLRGSPLFSAYSLISFADSSTSSFLPCLLNIGIRSFQLRGRPTWMSNPISGEKLNVL